MTTGAGAGVKPVQISTSGAVRCVWSMSCIWSKTASTHLQIYGTNSSAAICKYASDCHPQRNSLNTKGGPVQDLHVHCCSVTDPRCWSHFCQNTSKLISMRG